MINAQTFQHYATNPSAFRNDLLIDVSGSVHRFADVMDPEQANDFAAIDPGLMRCNGRSTDPDALLRAYIERPRGGSKTTDIAICCLWAMAFAVRPIRAYAFASDKDQAALLKDAMATTIRLNPWLSSLLTVNKNEVVNIATGHPGEGSKLEVFTSDVGSSYGILPSLIVADEVTHWQDNAEPLWHSLLSSAAKRDDCLVITIANAGYAETWQWKVREVARMDDAWAFRRWENPPSWMSEQRLDEMRRLLPAVAFERLFHNISASAGGDALTSRPTATACAAINAVATSSSRSCGRCHPPPPASGYKPRSSSSRSKIGACSASIANRYAETSPSYALRNIPLAVSVLSPRNYARLRLSRSTTNTFFSRSGFHPWSEVRS